MRLSDPQKTQLHNPVPQRDEKGVMILGSRMTRSDLLEYIRTRRREAEEKRNYQPPPQPMTERQREQIELEKAAGKRRLEYFAALEARRLDATNRAEQSGSTAASPVIAPAGQDANATALETRQLPEAANEADTAAWGRGRKA
jgi:hypothetical protein